MLLKVNGKNQHFDLVSTVSDLLEALSLDPRTVVVEVNERIVRRERIGEADLSEGDEVEILRFVGGG